jgi:hypothetical protein
MEYLALALSLARLRINGAFAASLDYVRSTFFGHKIISGLKAHATQPCS